MDNDDSDDLRERIQELEDELQNLKETKKQKYTDSATVDEEIEDVHDQIRDEADQSGMSRRKFMKAIAGGGAALGAAAMVPSAAALNIESNNPLRYNNNFSVDTQGNLNLHDNNITNAGSIGSTSIHADELVSKGAPVYDVTHPDFGAVGDGQTDDSDALQAAKDAAVANGGGVVRIPPGTYLDDSKNTTLTIDNDAPLAIHLLPGATIKKGSNAPNGVVISVYKTPRLEIVGGEIDGNADNGAPSNSDLIRSDGTDPKEQITIADTYLHDAGAAIALRTEGLESVTLDNVRAEAQYTTTHPLITIGASPDDITIRGCHFEDTKDVFHTFGAGFDAENVKVANTDIIADNSKQAIHLESGGTQVRNWTFENCWIEQRGDGDCIYTVSGDATDIKWADTTFVGGRVRPRPPGNQKFLDCTFENAPVVFSGTKDMTFADCEFRDMSVQEPYMYGQATVDRLTVRDCEFREGQTNDIFLNETAGVNKDITITGCRFINGNQSGQTGANGAAIKLRKSMDGLQITDNRQTGSSYTAFVHTVSNPGVNTPTKFVDNQFTQGQNTAAYASGSVTVTAGGSSTVDTGVLASLTDRVKWTVTSSNDCRVQLTKAVTGGTYQLQFDELTGSNDATVEYVIEAA